jgi:hypothetical protein
MPPWLIKMRGMCRGKPTIDCGKGYLNTKRVLRASPKINNVAIIPAKKLFTQIIGSDLARHPFEILPPETTHAIPGTVQTHSAPRL